MIDHIGIRVRDLPASRRMYVAALAELGFVVLSEGEFEGDAYVLFGRGDRDDFCLHTVGSEPGRDRVTTGAHIAFSAGGEDAVMRWHAAAVQHGGTDIGPPGMRPEYRGRYYAAFVLDPDGNNVEAVFHTAKGPTPRNGADSKRLDEPHGRTCVSRNLLYHYCHAPEAPLPGGGCDRSRQARGVPGRDSQALLG